MKFFDYLKITRNTTIGFNLKALHKALRGYTCCAIELWRPTGDAEFIIKVFEEEGTDKLTFPQLDIAIDRVGIPEGEYELYASMCSRKFDRVIKKAARAGDTSKIAFRAHEMGMMTKGDIFGIVSKIPVDNDDHAGPPVFQYAEHPTKRGAPACGGGHSTSLATRYLAIFAKATSLGPATIIKQMNAESPPPRSAFVTGGRCGMGSLLCRSMFVFCERKDGEFFCGTQNVAWDNFISH